MKIIAVHLYNDYSGSPKVLSQLVKTWTKAGHKVKLLINKRREGFLSALPEVQYEFFNYKLGSNCIAKIFQLFYSQVQLFTNILVNSKKGDMIYINTVLPFGAALAGKLKGNKIVYHVHETSITPSILKKLLFGIMKTTANEIIYVSNFIATKEPYPQIDSQVIYNCLESDFVENTAKYLDKRNHLQHILMICSLKEYKGVFEFLKIAVLLPELSFKLVLNANENEIKDFFSNNRIPENVKLYPAQKSVDGFYSWSDMVVNLSHIDAWIETFGLTILEGMAFGSPCIVPPVGGVTEIVEDGINGYQIDSKNILQIVKKISELTSDPEKYAQLKASAIEKVKDFSLDQFEIKANRLIEKYGKLG